MTKYRIDFKILVQFTDGFALNVVDVPISQIFYDFHDKMLIVTIDPSWKESNFDIIKDNQDYLWLFPISKKNEVLDELRAKLFLG